MTARITSRPLGFGLRAEAPVANPPQMSTSPPLRVHESPPSPVPSNPTMIEAAGQHERPADPPRQESTSSREDGGKRTLPAPERQDASAIVPAVPVPAAAAGPQLLAVVMDLRELGHSLAGAPVPMSPQRAPPPERHLSLVAGRPDALADIRDDLDNDDEA